MRLTTFNIEDEDLGLLRVKAAKQGVNCSILIRRAIKKLLAE